MYDKELQLVAEVIELRTQIFAAERFPDRDATEISLIIVFYHVNIEICLMR